MTSLYIDESKARGYVIVAAVVLDENATQLRKQVAQLRKPGQQKRIHFVDESDVRRRMILEEFARLGVRSRIFHAEGLSDRQARGWCLRQIAELAGSLSVGRIVLETDDSIVQSDRRTLYRELENRGLRQGVSYSHDRAVSEPLLWVPDAIAWSYARGNAWVPLVQPLIEEVVRFVG